jgi:hypothetical protein
MFSKMNVRSNYSLQLYSVISQKTFVIVTAVKNIQDSVLRPNVFHPFLISKK